MVACKTVILAVWVRPPALAHIIMEVNGWFSKKMDKAFPMFRVLNLEDIIIYHNTRFKVVKIQASSGSCWQAIAWNNSVYQRRKHLNTFLHVRKVELVLESCNKNPITGFPYYKRISYLNRNLECEF